MISQFGVGDDDKDLIAVVVVIAESEDENSVKQEIEVKKNQLKELIAGKVVEDQDDLVASLLDRADLEAISKMHKVHGKKNDKHFLADLLISRIATKDLLQSLDGCELTDICFLESQ